METAPATLHGPGCGSSALGGLEGARQRLALMAGRGQDDLSRVTAGQGDIFISAEPRSCLMEHSSLSLISVWAACIILAELSC